MGFGAASRTESPYPAARTRRTIPIGACNPRLAESDVDGDWRDSCQRGTIVNSRGTYGPPRARTEMSAIALKYRHLHPPGTQRAGNGSVWSGRSRLFSLAAIPHAGLAGHILSRRAVRRRDQMNGPSPIRGWGTLCLPSPTCSRPREENSPWSHCISASIYTVDSFKPVP